MSRAAKIFFASSVVLSGVTVWGVHFIQKRESDTMYQGVIKDEERMRQRALVQQQTQLSSTSSTSTVQATSTPPLNTPSAPVQQPAAVIDPDCVTCVISPPPELVEAQSKEQRAAERASRMAEYEAQRGLARRLEQEQGVGETRMV